MQKARTLLRTMGFFRFLMGFFKVDVYRANATSVLWATRDGDQLLRQIKNKSGLKVHKITGSEQARLLNKNTVFDPIKSLGNKLYVTIDGRSTEFFLFVCDTMLDSCMFNIGTVGLSSRKLFQKEIVDMTVYLQNLKAHFGPFEIIGTGGNTDKLFRLARVPKHRTVSIEKLKEQRQLMESLTLENGMETFYMNPEWLNILLPTCEIMLEIAEIAQHTTIFAPDSTIVHGIVYEIIEKMDREKESNVVLSQNIISSNNPSIPIYQDSWIETDDWLDGEENYCLEFD